MNRKKINVLIVISQLRRGGAEKQLLLMAKYFDNTHFNFFLINLEPESFELKKDFQDLGWQVFNVPSNKKLNAIKFIYNIILHTKADVVQSWINTEWGRIAAILYNLFHRKKVKIVASERNNMFMLDRRFKRLFIFLQYILSYFKSTITFNSREPIRALNKVFFKISNIAYIPNGIELDLASPKSYNKGDTLNIVILARLEPQKNHQFLINALTENANLKLIRVYVVGGGRLYSNLLNLVRENKLEDNFIFTGEVENPTLILEKCHIGTLVSAYEGLSNSILEYMKMGLPIIATPVGENSLCIDGNGYLVKSFDEFNNAIDSYINNPYLVTQHSRESLERIKKFDIRNIVKEYERLYLSI